MHNKDFFLQAFVYLVAAVLSVPIAKRLGLGSVLGLSHCRRHYWSLRFKVSRR